MKKAFTLIELLVVIAIIAILAAILFPVFAQAKAAAKGTQSISNQKQIGLSIVLYAGDYDDILPRQDGCAAGSALNAELNTRPFNATGVGCSASPFYYRLNHFSWQKWVMPYVKNVDMFVNPFRGRSNRLTPSCPTGEWTGCGQLTASYALNLSLFGALNTYNASPTLPNQYRDSFRGGSINNLPDVAGAMIAMEMGNPNVAFAPTSPVTGDNGITQINYAPAVREVWKREFYKSATACDATNTADWTDSGQLDETRAPRGGFAVAYADGHTKFMKVDAFLAATPTAAEYGIALPAFTNAGVGRCMFPGGTFRISNIPNISINRPLWGLGG
ncbi:MAG: prepilin-type N-terminal cleavage/methylation domain-containing protein [Fimbriimonas sp.]